MVGPSRGPKGSGLALVAEILGGALAGGAVLDKIKQKNWGNLVVALDPAALGQGDRFPVAVRELLERVRSCSPEDPSVPVRVPGERSSALAGTSQIQLLLPLRVSFRTHPFCERGGN